MSGPSTRLQFDAVSGGYGDVEVVRDMSGRIAPGEG